MAPLLFFCSIAPLAGHVADRSWKNRFSRRAREFKTLLPHPLSRKKRSIMCLIANTPLFGEIRFNSKSFLCSLNYIEVSEVTRKKSSFWIPALYEIQDIPNGSIVSDRITTCFQKEKKNKTWLKYMWNKFAIHQRRKFQDTFVKHSWKIDRIYLNRPAMKYNSYRRLPREKSNLARKLRI